MDSTDRYPDLDPHTLQCRQQACAFIPAIMPGHWRPALKESSTTTDWLTEASRTPSNRENVWCSIVVPMLNESGTVYDFGQHVVKVMNELQGPCEVILVDDGSTDGTYEMMLALHAADQRFKVLSLSRNFGKEIAITAGLDVAKGDIIVMMDGDLQHPPELLHEFIRLWNQGYDVVYGVMSEREGQSWFKKSAAAAFYRALRTLAHVKAPAGAGDFRLVDRKALNAFLRLRETHRFVRGMWDWIGFRQIGIPYVPEERRAGKSKYTTTKLIRLALDGIIGFSSIPLRLALTFGGALAVTSFAGWVFIILGHIFDPRIIHAWVILWMIASTALSIQLLFFGLLGEYVGRIYDEIKGRPIYIVRNQHGFGEAAIVAHYARGSS